MSKFVKIVEKNSSIGKLNECIPRLTLTPMWTGGKSACKAGGRSGNGNGRGQDIMAATCGRETERARERHAEVER